MMNKIPELTEEQDGILTTVLYDYWAFEDTPAVNVYLQALKIADEQGLLTKEASLALKPDNYINWRWDNCGRDKWGHDYDIYHKGGQSVYLNIYFTQSKVSILEELEFNNFILAQEYCQNWLNNYLKEQNNE